MQPAHDPRVPLVMFGGRVKPDLDNPWSSHVSIGRAVLDLPACLTSAWPPGRRRDPADLVEPAASVPPSPAFGTFVCQPVSPNPAPTPSVSSSAAVGPVTLRSGTTLPLANDEPVQCTANVYTVNVPSWRAHIPGAHTPAVHREFGCWPTGTAPRALMNLDTVGRWATAPAITRRN